MTSSPAPQARTRWTSLLIRQRERAACPQLRVFHRIYESMGLGMHPTSLYPRRSRIAPVIEEVAGTEVLARDNNGIVRRTEQRRQTTLGLGVVHPCPLDLPLLGPHNAMHPPR